MRALLKREAGLERTLIAAADNNPLKLTATTDEAVRWLVRPAALATCRRSRRSAPRSAI